VVASLLLVMLHTGTMLAVILYFWKQWRRAFFQSRTAFKEFLFLLILTSAITGVLGEALIKAIEKFGFRNAPKAEVELLFSHLELIAPALAAAGVLILVSSAFGKRAALPLEPTAGVGLDTRQAAWIGAVQALCLPFRGFSRSGATISTGMIVGVPKLRAEEFSFALAVVLTPPAIAREILRLAKAEHLRGGLDLGAAMLPGVFGAVCAFLAGLLALKWLSRWLERGRWYWFGIYCLFAAAIVAALHYRGF
jgi:undecaprenyl-diphosphatase